MQAPHPTCFTPDARLTRQHLDFFEKNGCLHFKGFADQRTIAGFLREIDRVEGFLLNKAFAGSGVKPLNIGYDEQRAKLFIQRMVFASKYSRLLSQFLKDPRLRSFSNLAPAARRVKAGEKEKGDFVVDHYLNAKGGAVRQSGWQTEDPRGLFPGWRKESILKVGLHLDDCPFENGGLRILPGTHRQNIFNPLRRKRYTVDQRPDPQELGFNIEAGDLTVYDSRVWHRMQPSPYTGDRSRRRIIYVPVMTGGQVSKINPCTIPVYHIIGQYMAQKQALNVG